MKKIKLPEVSTKRFNTITVFLNILLLVATFYASKPHAIYGIERVSYYDKQTEILEELNKKLSSGKYTMLYFRDLNINVPNYGDEHIVMLGKIEK